MRDGRVKAKMSRKSTHSIMCNTGFSELKIKRYGIEIVVPKDLITREGNLKFNIKDMIKKNELTKENIEKLIAKGCDVRVA